MRLSSKILSIVFLLCQMNCLAQQISFDSLWIERDRIPNKFITNKITEEFALKRIDFIHDEFKKRGKIALSLEKELYGSYIHFCSKKNEKAISVLNSGLRNLKTKNDSLTFKYNALLAYFYKENEDFKKAEVTFNRNFELLKNVPTLEKTIPNEVVGFYNNYYSFLARNGEADLLEQILFRALALSQKINKVDYKGIIENQLGHLYFLKKDYVLAEKYLILSIKDTQKPHYKISRLIKLGEIYQQFNEKKKLQRVLSEAKLNLKLIRTDVLKSDVSKLQIAMLESQLYNSPSILLQAVEEFKKKSASLKSLSLGNAYLELGNHATTPANYYEAAILSSSASEKISIIKAEDVLFPDLYMRANTRLASTQDKFKASETLENAAFVATQINKSLVLEDQKYAFEEEFRDIISQGLLMNSNPASVFNFIEMAKAKVLNDALFDKYNQNLHVKPELIKKEKALQKKINNLRLTKHASAVKELTNLEIELGFLKEKIAAESPKYYQLKYNQKIQKAEDIQKTLKGHEALLNYFKDNDALYVSIITKEKVSMVKTKLSADFKQTLNAYIKTLYANPGLGNHKSGAAALKMYSYLFAPVLPYVKTKTHLTIIRDAEINLIPFEVLEPKPNVFLMDSFTFLYDYSASTRFNFSKAATSKFAFSQMGIAPFAEKSSLLKNAFREKELNSLPYSDDEITKTSGSIFKNSEATKISFVENYRKHDLIHFATHAQVDDANPARSFIAFFPNNSDYKLYTDELYSLNLTNTQLVILSACEAGRGKLLSGEGLLSLARAFTYAGCPSVITTLWKAHDESSAWISSRIHDYLQQGLNKSDAVRKAKQDFRKSELGRQFDHPYYWANFILIGNDEPLQFSFWQKYKWYCVGLLMLLLTIYFLVRTRRLKKRI